MFQWHGDDLILHCVIQPRASSDDFAGVVGQRFKIRLTAAPGDGKANKSLVKFLARQFKVPQKQIELISGENSRMKKIRIKSPMQILQQIADKIKLDSNA